MWHFQRVNGEEIIKIEKKGSGRKKRKKEIASTRVSRMHNSMLFCPWTDGSSEFNDPDAPCPWRKVCIRDHLWRTGNRASSPNLFRKKFFKKLRLYDSLMNDREIKNREWNWKSGGIFIFQNRLDSIPSFFSTLFDSWKDYEYRRRQNYFLMVFFMTVSQPADV